MIDQIRPFAGFDYIQNGNPTTDVNPNALGKTWLNMSTGEIFVCTDATNGANKWIGQQNSYIQAGIAPQDMTELEALWRVEDLSLADGDDVTSWQDYTTNHTATDSESSVVAPKYIADFASNSPAVYFDGYDISLSKGVGLTLGSDYIYADSGKSGMTLFGVVRPTNSIYNDGCVINFGSGANTFYALKVRMDHLSYGCSVDFGGTYGDAFYPHIVSTPQLFIYVIEFGISGKTYKNNIELSNDAITLSQLTVNEISEGSTRQSSYGPVAIGVQSKNNGTDDARSFNGAIFETGIFTKALTQSEIDSLFGYYQAKYNIKD